MQSVIGSNFVSSAKRCFGENKSALAAKPVVRRNSRLDSAAPFIGFSLSALPFAEIRLRVGFNAQSHTVPTTEAPAISKPKLREPFNELVDGVEFAIETTRNSRMRYDDLIIYLYEDIVSA